MRQLLLGGKKFNKDLNNRMNRTGVYKMEIVESFAPNRERHSWHPPPLDIGLQSDDSDERREDLLE